jgi:pilus assembly protein CpaF
MTVAKYLADRHLKKLVKDTLFGFGPLEDLLRLPTVNEIMVNACDEIFIEKNNILQKSGRTFLSDEVLKAIIERIVNRVGRRIDTAQPMVDARLPDGSRVNAVIPPLAVKGPCLTIRKFSRERLRMDDLVKCDTISPQVVEFLAACVKDRRSILVAGGTGAGKTTLLNCLASYVSTRERIVCIEDTHELTLDHPHVVFVECRDSNSEGKGRIAVSDLLRNALRQRPDRIIVGECRGDEALDMLQAMNTGHDGSMTTIHANNPADALLRLEVLVRDSGLPSDAIRRQIVSAVDIVVQLVRNEGPSGTRCVSEVTEVVGYDEARQAIQTRTLFRREYQPEVGKQLLFPTGQLPTFANELVRQGHIHLDLFLTGIAHNHG